MLRSPIRSVVRPTVRALVRSPLEAGRRRQTDIVRAIFGDATPGLHAVIEEALQANQAALGPELVIGNWITPIGYDNATSGAGIGPVVAVAGTTTPRSAVAISGLTVGKRYRVNTIKVSGGSTTLFVREGADAGTGSVVTSAVVPDGVTTSLLFTATGADMNLLFAGSSAGGAFSISMVSVREIDLSKCQAFEDAAGTVPVMSMEKPLGLLLDTSRGLVRGPELVTNGGFDDGLIGWTAVASGDAGTVVDDGRLLVSRSATGGTYQSINTVAGRWYEVIFSIQGGTSPANLRVFDGAHTGTLLYESATVSAGASANLRVVVQATSAVTTLYFRVTSGIGGTAYFDDTSVRELPGHHFFQPSNTVARPIVSRRVNLVGSSSAPPSINNASGTGSVPVVTPGFTGVPEALGGGPAARIVLALNGGTGSGDFSRSQINVTGFPAEGTKRVRLAMKSNTSESYTIQILNSFSGGSATVLVTPEWQEFAFTANAGNSTVSNSIWLRGNVPGISHFADISVGAHDFRPTEDVAGLPPYQRVNAPADYDEVGFPAYANFDGLDDWLQHAAMNLTSTDEVTVVGGLMKFSDSATGCFYEQSISSSSGSGKVAVFAPISNGQTAVTFRSRGSLSSDATATNIPAPVKLAFAGEGSRGGDLARLRIDGVVEAEITSDQGGSGYGNEVGFLGRRAGTSLPFRGRFYGLTVVGKALTEAQLTALEQRHGRFTGSMP